MPINFQPTSGFNSRTAKLSPGAVQMIREGWPRAAAAGWKQQEWIAECAAMLGVGYTAIRYVIARKTYTD